MSSSAYNTMNQLTDAEHEALHALRDTPYFVSTATNNVLDMDEIAYLWQARKLQLDAVRLQPYADILYEDIRFELMGMKAELSAALKAKIATATHPAELKVPFKSFFSTYEPSWPRAFVEGSFNWKASVAHGREEYVRAQTILDREMDCRIGVVRHEAWDDALDGCESCYGDDEDAGRKSWLLRPERTYNIVKKTDLLQRVGALFGPHFYVTLDSEYEGREVDGRTYMVYRNTFHLHYMPTPQLHRTKTLAATLVKYATHMPFALGPMDTVVGLLGEKVSCADAN
jgi:hypothetical protein